MMPLESKRSSDLRLSLDPFLPSSLLANTLPKWIPRDRFVSEEEDADERRKVGRKAFHNTLGSYGVVLMAAAVCDRYTYLAVFPGWRCSGRVPAPT